MAMDGDAATPATGRLLRCLFGAFAVSTAVFAVALLGTGTGAEASTWWKGAVAGAVAAVVIAGVAGLSLPAGSEREAITDAAPAEDDETV